VLRLEGVVVPVPEREQRGARPVRGTPKSGPAGLRAHPDGLVVEIAKPGRERVRPSGRPDGIGCARVSMGNVINRGGVFIPSAWHRGQVGIK
jgi:hypothetical protein